MHDPVNHPSHYTQSGGIECIEALEAAMSTEAFHGFLRGNVIKYAWRYEHKNGREDLLKARWYLDRLIDSLAVRESPQAIVNHDPDDYLNGSCPDGYCPMPNVRLGPSEDMFPRAD